MVLKLWFAQESNNIKWPEISKGHNSNKHFMKFVKKKKSDDLLLSPNQYTKYQGSTF